MCNESQITICPAEEELTSPAPTPELTEICAHCRPWRPARHDGRARTTFGSVWLRLHPRSHLLSLCPLIPRFHLGHLSPRLHLGLQDLQRCVGSSAQWLHLCLHLWWLLLRRLSPGYQVGPMATPAFDSALGTSGCSWLLTVSSHHPLFLFLPLTFCFFVSSTCQLVYLPSGQSANLKTKHFSGCHLQCMMVPF